MAAGLAVDGVLLYNGVTNANIDAMQNEISSMDYCLQHASSAGQMHHHSISPCVSGGLTPFSATVKPNSCSDGNCTKTSFMYANWSP
jgi:hypothetical protein